MFSANHQRYWQWEGIDDTGQRQQGIITASSLQQAKAYLHQHNVIPVTVRRFLSFSTPCCSAKVLTQWLSHLQQLLSAGLSLRHALSVMMQVTTTPCTSLLTQQVQRALSEGRCFSDTLQHTPHAHLTPIECALLATAEQQSVLRQGLAQLIEHRQHQHAWQQQYRQQMRYPLTLIAAGIGTLALMMTLVVPRFAQLYQQSGRPLPGLTRGLIQFTNIFTASGWPYLALTFLLAAGWHWRHHYRIATITARLPLLATLHRHQLGLTLLEQLLLMRQLHGQQHSRVESPAHHPLAALTHQLHNALAAGTPLSHVMSSCRSGSRPLFSKDVIHLLRIGEQTGQMDDLLKQACRLLEQHSEHYQRTITTWLEPLLLSGLGLVIGVLMLSLYLPILDMKDVMT